MEASEEPKITEARRSDGTPVYLLEAKGFIQMATYSRASIINYGIGYARRELPVEPY